MAYSSPSPLRSPRGTLDSYVILPRLIDKVRLHAKGQLPAEYIGHLLKPGLSMDGRFLTFTGLDGEALRRAILATNSDTEVVTWVKEHAHSHSDTDKREWAAKIEAYRPDAERAQVRRAAYPELAAKIDVAAFSPFDVIDMDEGLMPIPDQI